MRAANVVMGSVLAVMGVIIMIAYGSDSAHAMKNNILYGGGALAYGIFLIARNW